MKNKLICGHCKRNFKTTKAVYHTSDQPMAGLYYLYDQGYDYVCKICVKCFGGVAHYIIGDKEQNNKMDESMRNHNIIVLPLKKRLLTYQKKQKVPKKYWIGV